MPEITTNMRDLDDKISNWETRVELAASYRLLDKLGYNEGINNLLTAVAPAYSGQGEVILSIPDGLHWSEVTASNLLGVDTENNLVVEGNGSVQLGFYTLHAPIYKLNSKAQCIMHVHAPYSTAIAMVKDFKELPMTHQNSTMFYGRVAVDQDYNGIATTESEGHRMALVMKDKPVLFMKNHGVCVVGPDVAQAVYRLYFLERACMFHVLAMSTGKEVAELPETSVKTTHKDITANEKTDAEKYLHAMMRVLARESPDYKM